MAREYVPIIDYYGIESPVATEMRRLLHNLRKRDVQPELKSILLTSATTGEGKSTVSALLAITAARKGFRTLLIDCDLRRPMLHRLFAIDRQHGLTEALSDGIQIKTVIRKTALENLDVVTAGAVTPHPTEVFDAKAIGAMVNEQKFYYDYVFCDSPPVIPVSDPMLLAQEVDGALLVVKAGATPREIVIRAKGILTSNQNNLIGVVLNNVKGTLPYYYDYSHYHYDYSIKPGDKKESHRQKSGTPNGGPGSPDASSEPGPNAGHKKQMRR
jgi:capsular exopolysaccharide synthesis family protein